MRGGSRRGPNRVLQSPGHRDRAAARSTRTPVSTGFPQRGVTDSGIVCQGEACGGKAEAGSGVLRPEAGRGEKAAEASGKKRPRGSPKKRDDVQNQKRRGADGSENCSRRGIRSCGLPERGHGTRGRGATRPALSLGSQAARQGHEEGRSSRERHGQVPGPAAATARGGHRVLPPQRADSGRPRFTGHVLAVPSLARRGEKLSEGPSYQDTVPMIWAPASRPSRPPKASLPGTGALGVRFSL